MSGGSLHCAVSALDQSHHPSYASVPALTAASLLSLSPAVVFIGLGRQHKYTLGVKCWRLRPVVDSRCISLPAAVQHMIAGCCSKLVAHGQMGIEEFTVLWTFSKGKAKQLFPALLLQQYTSAPAGQHTTADTTVHTKAAVGPRILHLQGLSGDPNSKQIGRKMKLMM